MKSKHMTAGFEFAFWLNLQKALAEKTTGCI
jgi:hypothetical protein